MDRDDKKPSVSWVCVVGVIALIIGILVLTRPRRVQEEEEEEVSSSEDEGSSLFEPYANRTSKEARKALIVRPPKPVLPQLSGSRGRVARPAVPPPVVLRNPKSIMKSPARRSGRTVVPPPPPPTKPATTTPPPPPPVAAATTSNTAAPALTVVDPSLLVATP